MGMIKYAYVKANGEYITGTAKTLQCSDIILGMNVIPTTSGKYKGEIKLKDAVTNTEISFYTPLQDLVANTEYNLEAPSFKLRYANTLIIVWNVLYNANGQTIESGTPAFSLSNRLIIPDTSEGVPDVCEISIDGTWLLYAIIAAVIIVAIILYLMTQN